MRSSKKYHKETTTTIARGSRGKGRSPWRTFIAVVLAVGAIASSPATDWLVDVVDASPPAVSCSVESTFDAQGVERWRKEACGRDD